MVKHRRSASGQAKAKKSKGTSEYDADAVLSLKESIESGRLGHKDLLKLVEADQEPCAVDDKTYKGRKDNPNCLVGLVPAPGGFRRKGLWQKEPEAIAGLGYDPNDLRREVIGFLNRSLRATVSCATFLSEPHPMKTIRDLATFRHLMFQHFLNHM